MTPTMDIDTKELQAAMQLYSRATRKDEVEIVNRAAMVTLTGGKGVVGAIRRTKKAETRAIEDKLNSTGWSKTKPKLKWVLGAKKLAGSGRIASTYYKRNTKGGKKAGDIKTNNEWTARVAREGEKILRRRKASAAYLQAGWKKALVDGGWSTKGPAKKFKGKIGYGTRAVDRGSRPIFAEFGNFISYAAKPSIGAAIALQQALKAQARDMVKYAERKMGETARKYSAKR